MTNQLFKDRATMDRLCSGPLGPYTDPFAVRLSQQGYAKRHCRWYPIVRCRWALLLVEAIEVFRRCHQWGSLTELCR